MGKDCLTALVWCFLFFVIIATPLFSVGLVRRYDAESMFSSNDFMEYTCSITKVNYLGADQERRRAGDGYQGVRKGEMYDYRCTDAYDFFFLLDASQSHDDDDFLNATAVGGGGEEETIYKSVKVIIERKSDSCSESGPSPPQFKQGQTVPCWKPQGMDEIPPIYECGNSECIKIFDPQLDRDKVLARPRRLWIAGSVFLAIACSILICSFFQCYRICKKTRDRDDESAMTIIGKATWESLKWFFLFPCMCIAKTDFLSFVLSEIEAK